MTMLKWIAMALAALGVFAAMVAAWLGKRGIAEATCAKPLLQA